MRIYKVVFEYDSLHHGVITDFQKISGKTFTEAISKFWIWVEKQGKEFSDNVSIKSCELLAESNID
jgi:hypothetical protein